MYYKNRYYSPDLGRFVSRDPVGYKTGSYSLYEYVRSSPTSLFDSTGLDYVVTNLEDVDLLNRLAWYACLELEWRETLDANGNVVSWRAFNSTRLTLAQRSRQAVPTPMETGCAACSPTLRRIMEEHFRAVRDIQISFVAETSSSRATGIIGLPRMWAGDEAIRGGWRSATNIAEAFAHESIREFEAQTLSRTRRGASVVAPTHAQPRAVTYAGRRWTGAEVQQQIIQIEYFAHAQARVGFEIGTPAFVRNRAAALVLWRIHAALTERERNESIQWLRGLTARTSATVVTPYFLP